MIVRIVIVAIRNASVIVVIVPKPPRNERCSHASTGVKIGLFELRCDPLWGWGVAQHSLFSKKNSSGKAAIFGKRV
jgi:hypothetical protein